MPGWMRALVRFLMVIWFRSIEVVGADGCPSGVPMIVIGNHENGLIDPMLIAASLPVRPRFVAKSTLWKNPLLRFFFSLGRIIPVYRKQDAGEGADMSKNAETFAAAAKVLGSGGSICIFPEGQSHTEPMLQPLKTGAARMAMSGPPSLRILPVGIAFDRRDRFRSRALLVVGEPIDPAAERARYDSDPKGAVHALTDRMAAGLQAVTINVPTWEERRLLERAVEIARPEEETLEARTRLTRAFFEAYQWLRSAKPEEVEALRAEVARYDRTLRVLGLSDTELRERYTAGSVVRWASRFVRLVLLRLPMGITGAILHALPYQLPRLVAKRRAKELDQPASWKLMAAVVIYPVWWLLLAGIVFALRGGELAFWTLVLVPVTGYVALLWLEGSVRLADQARAFLLMPLRKRLIAGLGPRRETIRKEIADLEAVWRAAGQGAQGTSATR
jgi:glycerol-3-phosphate O-acyltransferase/dihydroxyacetone phosphate acyltransferase